MSDFEQIVDQIREFRQSRDWEQFHDPKNLAEAISIEAGELLEHFLWKTADESRSLPKEERQRIAQELADILIFAIYMGIELQIDLPAAIMEKIKINELKYPADKAKGSSKKYTDL